MKCHNCSTEVEENSKFCPRCGEKIEEKKEDIGKLYSDACGCWFLLGMRYGTLKGKKDEKKLKEIEDQIRKYNLYDKYLEALTFAKNHISQSKFNGKGTDNQKFERPSISI